MLVGRLRFGATSRIANDFSVAVVGLRNGAYSFEALSDYVGGGSLEMLAVDLGSVEMWACGLSGVSLLALSHLHGEFRHPSPVTALDANLHNTVHKSSMPAACTITARGGADA